MPRYNLLDTEDSDLFAKPKKTEDKVEKPVNDQDLKDDQNLDDISELHPSDEPFDARTSEEILDEALLAPSIEEEKPEEAEPDTFETFNNDEEEDEYNVEQEPASYESQPISSSQRGKIWGETCL